MQIKDIEKLIDKVNESELTEFKIEMGEVKIKMKKEVERIVEMPQVSVPMQTVVETVSSTPSPTPVKTADGNTTCDIEGCEVTSPIVGTFYEASSPDADPYVKVGDKVKKGDVLCIVEAMKLMNEIESDVDGEIVEILVSNGEMVEFGQALYRIK